MPQTKKSGKAAWDKEKTHELFRRYKEDGDLDAREKLVMSHMNLVRFWPTNSRTGGSRSMTSFR